MSLIIKIKGFHLSKYGHNNFENLKAAYDRTLEAHIPLDVQYAVSCSSHPLGFNNF